MSKVLLLCFDYPPSKAIGGFRPHSWSKYFHEHGIELTIITRHWDQEIRTEIDCLKASSDKHVTSEQLTNGKVIRTPFYPNRRDRFLLKYGNSKKIIRKFWSYLYLLLPYLSLKFDNTSGIYHQAENFLTENKCDLIIATAGPFILFKHASRLSRYFQIPWIADYRDTWSKNHFQNPIFQLPIDLIHAALEKKYIKNAVLVTVVTKGTKKLLEDKIAKRRIEIIYNGFDQEVLEKIDQTLPDSEVLRIAYAGSLYPPQRLDMFIEGFTKFIDITPDAKIEVNFYGLGFHPEQADRLKKMANNQIVKYINIIDRVPYEKLIEQLCHSNLLLLLSYEGQYWLTAKVLDYLGVNRKILMVQNDKGEIEEFLREYGDAAFCSDSEELYQRLSSLYKEFQEQGHIACKASRAATFNRSNQAKKMARLINEITTHA